MKFLPMAAVLLLGACAPQKPGPEGVCDREAWNDPQVKVLLESASTNTAFAFEHGDEQRAAFERARLACLRRTGVISPGGGVERVQQPKSIFEGIR